MHVVLRERSPDVDGSKLKKTRHHEAPDLIRLSRTKLPWALVVALCIEAQHYCADGALRLENVRGVSGGATWEASRFLEVFLG